MTSGVHLAPRDIVARAIDNEMKTSGDEFVFLDGTHLEGKGPEAKFSQYL